MDFPRGPVVKTPNFHCRGHGFNPWSVNQDPVCQAAKKIFFRKRKTKKKIIAMGITKDSDLLYKK